MKAETVAALRQALAQEKQEREAWRARAQKAEARLRAVVIYASGVAADFPSFGPANKQIGVMCNLTVPLVGDP